jgi:hypothetical protein
MPGPPVYCCDTSSLIHAWRRAYPPKNFKTFWAKLDNLISAGRLVSSVEIYRELQKKDDDLFAWVKERKAAFLEIDDDIQAAMGLIMSKYPRLVDTVRGKSGAGPFVIAHALSASPQLTVLHQELGGSFNSPKIPFVCDQERVLHVDLLALIDKEGWSF